MFLLNALNDFVDVFFSQLLAVLSVREETTEHEDAVVVLFTLAEVAKIISSVE